MGFTFAGFDADFAHTWVLHCCILLDMETDDTHEHFTTLAAATARVTRRLVTPDAQKHRNEWDGDDGEPNNCKSSRDSDFLDRRDHLQSPD